MKKAKIMLTAIAVLAVVGGALAFKARTQHVLYTGPAGGGICTEKVEGATFGAITNPLVAASTVPLEVTCPDKHTTTITD